MIPALVSLKNLIKNKSYHIDYPFFRLHYQVTVSALLAFCLILTAKVLFGDTIDCSNRELKRDGFFDNICYAHGTYTEFSVHDDFKTFENEATQYFSSGLMIPSEQQFKTRFWHHYYQYMPIILFLQALFFYLPHYLWKSWENGIISSICKQLHDNRFTPNEYIESNYHIVDYLKKCFTLHKSLVYKYFSCHILLFVNLVLQIFALNEIFNKQFLTYGFAVFQYIFIDKDIYGFKGDKEEYNNDLNSPMDFVFPKVTGCTVRTLAHGGANPTNDFQFLCVLPLNILHDKFFLILWCWLIILAGITVWQIIFDILYTTMPMFRKYIFKKRFGAYLSDDNRHSSSLPELFLLDLIGSNSDKFAFAALLRKLNKDDWSVNCSENQSLDTGVV